MIRKSSGILQFIATLVFTCTLLPAWAKAEIRYTVSLAHPEQHLFHVTVEVPDVKDHVELQMAAWDALYEIRDFSSHVQRVSASVNGQDVPIEKLDKLTWRVHASGTVKVSYDTFWDDPGPFSSQLNSEHAFINPAMILLYVPDRRSEDCALNFGGVPADWKIATSLGSAGAQSTQIAPISVAAPNFAALADSPIEASHF